MTLKLKPAIKARWLEALRSGKIKQARSALRKGDSMCCLGVLCNLHAEDHPDFAAGQHNKRVYDDQDQVPSLRVLKWAFEDWKEYGAEAVYLPGMEASLAEKNDQGASFKQIADLIEKHL
jgi:hypothetical protein